MEFITNPITIESESMHYIRQQLNLPWQDYELPIVERLIHASGDPSLEHVIFIHPDAVEAGMMALDRGADVITDVEMVRVGISKGKLEKLGGEAICFLNDPRVSEQAKSLGLTRTMTAFRLNANLISGAIVAIGNAPTALLEVLRIVKETDFRPALIVGMPVGFVGAKESKELLWARKEIPSITIKGTRGGSPLAAAAVNALIYAKLSLN